MRSIWRLTILAGGIVTAAQAEASDWRYLTSGSDVQVFVDVQSVRSRPAIPVHRPFEARQIWVKFTNDHADERGVKETLSLKLVNCAADTMMSESSTSYYDSGKSAGSASWPDYDFQYKPVPPDSVGMTIIDFLCGRSSLPHRQTLEEIFGN